MNCEFEIAELFLGDIRPSGLKSLESVELRIGRIYRIGLKMYAALGFPRHIINRQDIEHFRSLLRRHKEWMSQRIYIPVQGCIRDEKLAGGLSGIPRGNPHTLPGNLATA